MGNSVDTNAETYDRGSTYPKIPSKPLIPVLLKATPMDW